MKSLVGINCKFVTFSAKLNFYVTKRQIITTLFQNVTKTTLILFVFTLYSSENTSPKSQGMPKVENNDSKFDSQSSPDASIKASAYAFPSSAAKKDKDFPVLDTSTQLDSSVLQPPSREQAFPLLFARLEGYHSGTDRER